MADKFNFTKAALDSLPLPAGGQRAEYCDARQPSLRLRVTSTGVKTFCVLKRIKGAGMERFTLARYPEMTIEQARKKAAEIIGKMAEGNNPAEARRALKKELTFDEMFQEYAERHGKRKRSWRDDDQRYRDYLQKPLGKHKLGTITTAMISRVLGEIERSGKSGALFNGVRALASALFSKAIEYGYVSANPVSQIPLKKVVKRDRFLLAQELPRFFHSLSEEPNATVRDYFLVSLLTGARRANVLAMRWDQLDIQERIWRIPDTKNGEPQNLPLGDEAVAILTQRKAQAAKGDAFVFPGDGHSGHLVEPKRGWQRILDRDELKQLTDRIESAGGKLGPLLNPKTGRETYESLEARLKRARKVASGLGVSTEGARITNLRIHDLRRTLGSWQAKTGSSLVIIGKSLNHKTPAATAIYARLDVDPVRASVEKATSAMLIAAGIKDQTETGKDDR